MRPSPNPSLPFVVLPMLATLLLVAALYALTVWQVSGRLEARSAVRLEQRVQALAERLSADLRAHARGLEQAARAEGLRAAAAPAQQRAELDWLRARSPGLVWLGLTDAEGVVRVGSQGWLEGESMALTPLFREARKGTVIASFQPPQRLAPELARAGRRVPWVAHIGVPLHDAGGPLRGVLAAQVDAAALVALGDGQIGERERSELGLSWHLVAADGSAIGEAPPFDLPAAAAGPAVRTVVSAAGGWRLVARPLAWSADDGGAGWQVVVAQREDAVQQPLRELQRSLTLFAAVALVAAGVFGLAAARRIVRPFDELLALLAARLPADGDGRGGFRGTLRRLQAVLPPPVAAVPSEQAAAQLVARLVRDADRLQRVVDSLPLGVALLSPRGSIDDANAPLQRLLGAALRGERLADRIAEAAPRAQVAWHFETPAGQGAAGLASLTHCSLVHADGQAVPVALQWLPLATEAGDSPAGAGTLLIVQDLSAQLEVAARAEALSARLAVFARTALDYGFVTLDGQARVVDWSPGATALTGREAQALAGADFASLFDAAEQAQGTPARLLAEALEAGRARLQARLQRLGGPAFTADGMLYAIRQRSGVSACALVFSDATRALAASRLVTESEERLAAVIGSASDAIISTDAEGRVQLFNPAAERIFGRPATALIGQPLDLLLPPGHGDSHRAAMAGFAASQASKRPMGVGLVQGLRADGTVLALEASISRAVVGGQTVLTAILRDVTERLRAEQVLLDTQRQLAGLTQRLLEQEKQTTQRLAQALHDELGQTLAAQGWLCDAALQREALPPWAQKLHTLVRQANQQVRRVLTELRPPLLDEQGLVAALDNELANRRALQADAAAGPALRLDTTALPAGLRWPADVEYAAFMVAREAVGNALRHAGAASVQVALEGDAGTLRLCVRDDGVGAPTLPQALHPGHLGLVGMRERALAIGATLELQSSEQAGTTVLLAWCGSGRD